MNLEKILLAFDKNLPWLKNNLIYLARHGSKAYGTNIETSDDDFRGVCVAEKKNYLGFNSNFEQAELKNPDTVIFEIRKFFKLASEGNPNALEILFVNEEDIIYTSDLGKILLENRNLFLSKKIKHTMFGYAMSQLKRIKLHRKYLLNPPTKPPTRSELGLPEQTTIPKDQLMAVYSEISKEINKLNFDFMSDLEPSTKIEIKNNMIGLLSDMKIYSDDMFVGVGRKIGLSENLIEIVKKERQYESLKREWDQYNHWKKTRNPVRAGMEEQFGFDCFTDDTEFLTDSGFKKFDDITEYDKLATVFINNTDKKMERKKNFGIEYQNYTERFDCLFNGNLYNFYGNHLDVCVTPNHRMLFRSFSRKLNKPKGNWVLGPAAAMINISETFDFLKAIEPNKKKYCYGTTFNNLPISSVDYMKLMGAFLSDGSIQFKNKKNGKMAVSITISQKQNNRLHSWMKKFYNKYKDIIKVSLYSYKRKVNKFRKKEMTEILLSIREEFIVNKLYNDCGHSKNKRIPRWVFGLSKGLMETMYNYMHLGDGTVRNTTFKSNIYYSSLKTLADDVQELAILCGWEASLYGPYKKNNGTMYQVHINKNTPNTARLTLNNNLKKIPVKNCRVVCFSVPNSTLIIRRNGHVSIQGNCKHGLHLLRLSRMCKETLAHGNILVRRPDAEELVSIRKGAWTYEQLIENADKEQKEIEEAFKSSKLPNEPNRAKLNELCSEIIEKVIL